MRALSFIRHREKSNSNEFVSIVMYVPLTAKKGINCPTIFTINESRCSSRKGITTTYCHPRAIRNFMHCGERRRAMFDTLRACNIALFSLTLRYSKQPRRDCEFGRRMRITYLRSRRSIVSAKRLLRFEFISNVRGDALSNLAARNAAILSGTFVYKHEVIFCTAYKASRAS